MRPDERHVVQALEIVQLRDLQAQHVDVVAQPLQLRKQLLVFPHLACDAPTDTINMTNRQTDTHTNR